jgi:hypothetical protein
MCFKLYDQFSCSSFILPEHKEALAKHENEIREKIDIPCIDELQLELWSRLVSQSYRNGQNITVKTFYKNRFSNIVGVVLGFIADQGLLRILTSNGEKKVKIKGIIAINGYATT